MRSDVSLRYSVRTSSKEAKQVIQAHGSVNPVTKLVLDKYPAIYANKLSRVHLDRWSSATVPTIRSKKDVKR